MPDYIKGPVEKIIDGETLLVEVVFISKTNQNEYDEIITINISKLEPPFLKNIDKTKWKERLEKKLLGVTVYCYLQSKNKDGSYTARVVCDGPKFRGKRKRV